MAGNHPIVVIWTAILFHEITCRSVCRIIERFFGCLWSDQPQGDLKIQDCSNLFGWFYGKTIDLGWLGCLMVPQKHRDQKMGKNWHWGCPCWSWSTCGQPGPSGRMSPMSPLFTNENLKIQQFFPWFFMDGWIPFVGAMCEVHFKPTSYISISDHLWIVNSCQFQK